MNSPLVDAETMLQLYNALLFLLVWLLAGLACLALLASAIPLLLERFTPGPGRHSLRL